MGIECIMFVIFHKVITRIETITVNSRFKKDLKMRIHLQEAFFSDDRFLDSLHKYFINQTTLDLRQKNRTLLNREFTVLPVLILSNQIIG